MYARFPVRALGDLLVDDFHCCDGSIPTARRSTRHDEIGRRSALATRLWPSSLDHRGSPGSVLQGGSERGSSSARAEHLAPRARRLRLELGSARPPPWSARSWGAADGDSASWDCVDEN